MTADTATVDEALASRFVDRAEASGLIDVAVTTMDSPIGTLLLMATRRGLVRIAFESENRDEVLRRGRDEPLAADPRGTTPPRPRSPRARQLLQRQPSRLRPRPGLVARRTVRSAGPPPDRPHTVRSRSPATATSRTRSARRARRELSAMRSARTRSRSWCRATEWSAPAATSAATAAGYRASAGCWTSRRAERDRLPAGRWLAAIEQPDEILGASDRLPPPREEVLGDHPVVGNRGHRDRPLIERAGHLDLVGAAFIAHDDTACGRPASTVVASRGRHSHREHLQYKFRPAEPVRPDHCPPNGCLKARG